MAEADLTQPLRVIVRDANLLASKRQQLTQDRSKDTREWALNRAFYKGNQWAFWNRVTSQVESLPTEDGDKPRYKVRLVSNQILPGVQHYVAQLMKTKPVIHATPDSGEYRDVLSAQVGEALYEYWWDAFDLTSKLKAALTHATISQGYWILTWDPLAGKTLKVMLHPETGQPLTDGDLSDAYRSALEEQAQQMGLDPQAVLQQYEKVVSVGEICVEAVPGENVILDPTASNWTDADFAICKHALDVDEIQARWPKAGRMAPDSVPSDPDVPLAFAKSEDKKPLTTKDVWIGYFRPGPALPKGRYVVWTEGPNKILAESDWPYPFTELPLVKFPGLERPNSVYDEALVTHARPMQKELNRTLSQVVEHKNLTIKPQMVAPYGSLRQRLTGEPGAVFEYNPIQGLQPEWRPNPPLPQYVFEHLGDIQMRLDKLFNRMPSSRDSLPARVDAGYTVELIQEAVADQISPVIMGIESSLARAGNIMAAYAQTYYIEPRLMKIKGANGSTQVKKFVNADLSGGFSFHAEAGTGLPRTRAGRQQQIMDLIKEGLLDPKTGMRYLDLADLKGVQQKLQADEDQAYREHEKLIRGEILNPTAYQQAEQQIQQVVMQAQQTGQIPDLDGDGQPDTPQELQQWIHDTLSKAAVATQPFEDPSTHLDVHGLYMKSSEFETLQPDAQQRFLDHYNATLDFSYHLRKIALTFDPKVMPKVDLNARTTVSAPVMTEILSMHGINVSEQDVAAAPLDTAVFDDLSKPNVEGSGNTPVDDAAKALEMAQMDAENKMNLASAAHNLTKSQNAAALDQASSEQAMAHAEETHQQKLAHAEQLHQARLQQMKERPTKQSSGG